MSVPSLKHIPQDRSTSLRLEYPGSKHLPQARSISLRLEYLRLEASPSGLSISGSKHLPQARVPQAQSTSLRLEYLNLETLPLGLTNSLRLEYLRLEAKCTWVGVDWHSLNKSRTKSIPLSRQASLYMRGGFPERSLSVYIYWPDIPRSFAFFPLIPIPLS